MAAGRLIGDIGATYVRFALASDGQIHAPEFFQADNFSGLRPAIEHYLDILKRRGLDRPVAAALAIAGPVSEDRIVVTNRKWEFSKAQITKELNLSQITFLNDFAAVARAVKNLTPVEKRKIGGGEEVQNKTVAIIGPGTGLGMAGLVHIGGLDHEIPGEGGHGTVPANDPEESRLIELLRLRWKHVSLERVLSGSGLVNLYNALCIVHGVKKLNYERAEHVTAAAFPKDDSVSPDTLCRQAFAIFCNMLGTAAGNLALTLGARGGVYIAGGIVPRFPRQFEESGFRQRFEDKGRLSDYVKRIPTWLVLHEAPALVGLANMT